MDVLTRLDDAFLEAEDADQSVSMAIASVAIFDGPPPAQQELLRALTSRLPLVPRYYQRVRRLPFNLSAPVWVNDPDFDIGYHVRRTALPAPGGDAELFGLIGRVMAQRLDRDRPLWEMWVIEGLEGGRWAVISKVHHCMVDGVAGTELYHLLLSATPDIDESLVDTGPFVPPAAEGGVRLAAAATLRAATGSLRPARFALQTARHPRRQLQRAGMTARGLLAIGHVVAPTKSTSLLGPIGRQRRYVAASVPMADVKSVRQRFNVTINDVALAMATAGFRALLLSRGEVPTAHLVRSLVPVNIRTPGTENELTNRVSCMFADLPVHISDPVQRLHVVHDLLVAAKNAHEAEAGVVVVELGEQTPFPWVSGFLRTAFRAPQRNLVTVTTNVPGPREPLYLLGRRMKRLLPFVPIADRVRIGVAILSYCDELSLGVTGDYDSAADIDVLLSAATSALEKLLSREALTG